MNPTDFKKLVAHPDRAAIADALADDVELRTPVTLRPFAGREVSATVLAIVLGQVIEEVEYTTEYVGDGSFCMVFRGRIGTAPCQGVDLVEVDAAGRISRVSVAIRPLPAVLAMARQMAQHLQHSGIPLPASDR